MPRTCTPCQARAAKKVANFSNYKYVVKDAQGTVVKQFENKAHAAVALSKNPGYTLHSVVAK